MEKSEKGEDCLLKREYEFLVKIKSCEERLKMKDKDLKQKEVDLKTKDEKHAELEGNCEETTLHCQTKIEGFEAKVSFFDEVNYKKQ